MPLLIVPQVAANRIASGGPFRYHFGMDSQLRGKVVVITGASGGIGSAIAAQFAAEGARLVLHYRTSRSNVEALQKKCKSLESMIIRADLTKERDVRRIFTRAIKQFDRVDTVILHAGSCESRDVWLHEMGLDQWKRTFDDVLTSAFLTLREFFQIVARQKHGNALLISSTSGVFGE